MNRTNKYMIFLIVTSLVFIMGCSVEDCEDFNCSTCYIEKPEWDYLKIDLTSNNDHPEVPIVIYRGNPEDGDIEYIDTATSRDFDVLVPLGKYYTVTAEYKVGDKTVIALDGDKILTENNVMCCDSSCYYIKGGKIDVTLKYEEIDD